VDKVISQKDTNISRLPYNVCNEHALFSSTVASEFFPFRGHAKPSYRVARSLCHSWASCYCDHYRSETSPWRGYCT